MKRSQRRRARPPCNRYAVTVEILLHSALWKAHRKAKTVLRQAISEAALLLGVKAGEVAVVLTNDAAIRVLNAKWRRRDRATDVLSFPAEAGRFSDGTSPLLGDIVIAYETTQREACTQKKPFMNHLVHLAVHGFLHLLGYDHEAQHDAEEMERLEISILARIGILDPYIEAGASTDS
jgi:probable rRNA maturation factor